MQKKNTKKNKIESLFKKKERNISYLLHTMQKAPFQSPKPTSPTRKMFTASTESKPITSIPITPEIPKKINPVIATHNNKPFDISCEFT